MKPALSIIDLQKQYYDTSPTAQPERDKAIPYINAAADFFRANIPSKKNLNSVFRRQVRFCSADDSIKLRF